MGIFRWEDLWKTVNGKKREAEVKGVPAQIEGSGMTLTMMARSVGREMNGGCHLKRGRRWMSIAISATSNPRLILIVMVLSSISKSSKANRRISNVEYPCTSAEAVTAHTRRRMSKGGPQGTAFVIRYSLSI
jgi:hypothetical protein